MADLTNKSIFTLNDSIYFLSAPGTWGTAQAEAIGLGGNLATVNNEAEQTFLAGLFAGQTSWIGYNDAGVEGTFQWINGENSVYTNWAAGQPDNDSNQDFVAIGSNGSWYDEQGTRQYRGIIEIKNPTTPILVVEDLGILEPYGESQQVLFKVKRFGSSGVTRVNYSTENGTGVAGTNYVPTSGTLIFNPGEVEKTIAVTVNRDSDTTSGEAFFLNLSAPINADLGKNRAKATILEPSGAVTFGSSTYLLTNPSNWGEAQVQARAFGGNLVTINDAKEQTFLAGVYAGKNLWIGYSDAGKEYNLTTREGFQWVSGTSAYTNWAGGRPDNDSNQDFVAIGSNGSWDDEQGTRQYQGIVEIPTSLSVPLTDLTQKTIYTWGDSIYLLTDTAKNWGEAQVEAQKGQGNLVTINNGAEQTFLAGLFAGQNLWTGYSDAGVEGNFQWINGENSAYTQWAGGQPDNDSNQDFVAIGNNGSWYDEQGVRQYKGIVEIKNPAIPLLTIEDIGIIEPIGGVRQAVFTVKRYGNSSSAATVNYSTADGTTVAGDGYTATSGTLIFNPGETEKTISVFVSPDADIVSGETFFVNLSAPTNALLADSQAKATILEASEIVTFNGHTYLLTTSANWGEAQLQARTFGGNLVTINDAQEQAFLAGKYAGQNLWIGYSDAGKEYNVTTKEGFQWVSGTSAYTNWANGQPDNDSNQDFVVMGTNGSWYDEQGVRDYKGIIELPFTIPTVTPTVAINDPVISEAAGKVAFTITLSQASSQPVSMDYQTVNGTALAGSDYSAVAGKLTFAAGETTKVVEVPVVNDAITEANESFSLILSNPAGVILADNQGIATIINDDPDKPVIYQGDAGNNTATGSALDDQLFGNGGQDNLNGLAGNDLVCGGAGADVLTGGTGLDSFLFDLGQKFTKVQMGLDQVIDFTAGDKIVLDKTTFVGLSKLSFASVKNTAQARNSRASITYIRSTGILCYNENGNRGGFGAGGQFADLTNGLKLSRADISVVQ